MNIEITITDKKTDLASFEPVEGKYDLNLPSFDSGEIGLGEIADAIESELSAKHGFPVKVELFQSNGHAITDETPSAGNFLAKQSELEDRAK